MSLQEEQKENSEILGLLDLLLGKIRSEELNKEEFSELCEKLIPFVKEQPEIEALKMDPHSLISKRLASSLQDFQEKQLFCRSELLTFLTDMGLLCAFVSSANVSQGVRALGQCLYEKKQVNAAQKRAIDAWVNILTSLEENLKYDTSNDLGGSWNIAINCLDHLLEQKEPAIFADVICYLIRCNKLNRFRLDLVKSHKKLSVVRDFLVSLGRTGFATDENVMLALVGEFTFFFRVLLKFCWLTTKATLFMVSWGKKQIDTQLKVGRLPFVLDVQDQPWIGLRSKNLLTLERITLLSGSNVSKELAKAYLRFGKVEFLENCMNYSDQQLNDILTFIKDLKDVFEDSHSLDSNRDKSNKIDQCVHRMLCFGEVNSDLLPQAWEMLQDNVPEELKTFLENWDFSKASNETRAIVYETIVRVFKQWSPKRAVDLIVYLKAEGLLDDRQGYDDIWELLVHLEDQNLNSYRPVEFHYLLRISLSLDPKDPKPLIHYPAHHLKDFFDLLPYLRTKDNLKKLKICLKKYPDDLLQAILLCKNEEGCFLDERINCLIKNLPNSILNFKACLFENPTEELEQNSERNLCQTMSGDKKEVMKLPEVLIKPVYAAGSCSHSDWVPEGVSLRQQLLSI